MRKEPSPLFLSQSIFDQHEHFASFGSEFVIICDDIVSQLYGKKLKQYLQSFHVQIMSFPPGEKSKTREVKQLIEDQMLQAHFSSDATVIALGGGVTSDLAGFVAATYLRGVKLLVIPTTLLGMVDASIGGKRAVNTPYAKNSIGAYYPADAIWIDPSLLVTLDEIQWLEGYSEMIKHALIYSEEEFIHFEKKGSFKDTGAIVRSAAIKQAVIEQDRMQCDYRHLLNFGHTLAHALEKLTDYTLSHGIAVASGMLIESYLSYLKGHLPKEHLERITNLIISAYAPLFEISFSLDSLWEVMQRDKKAKQKIPQQVHLSRIGKGIPQCFPIDKKQLECALIWYRDVVSYHCPT